MEIPKIKKGSTKKEKKEKEQQENNKKKKIHEIRLGGLCLGLHRIPEPFLKFEGPKLFVRPPWDHFLFSHFKQSLIINIFEYIQKEI